jgi:hypothetical protein
MHRLLRRSFALTILVVALPAAVAVAASGGRIENLGTARINSCDVITQQGCSTKLVVVTNRTSQTVGYDTIRVSPVPPFALSEQDQGSCNFTPLAPGQSCTVGIAADPTTTGPVTGQVTLAIGTTTQLAATFRVIGIGGH